MALNGGIGIGIVFTASDLASSVIRNLAGSFLGLDSTVERSMANMAARVGVSTDVMLGAFRGLTVGLAAVTAGFAGLAILGSTVRVAADFEDTLVTIQQKSGLADEAIQDLTNRFLKLSSALPLSAQQLAQVGVVAAQMGITSVQAIEDLAFSASKLRAVAQDFGTEEAAALALGRLADAFRLPISQAENLGSLLVTLGDSTKTTASAISGIVEKAGPFAGALGVSADVTAALAATLSEAGVQTELAGSGLQRFFATALERTDKFGRLLGISGDELRRAFGRDASATVQALLAQLSKLSATELPVRLKELGLSGARNIQVMTILTQRAQQLGRNLFLANEAFGAGTSLQEKFDKSTQKLNAVMATLTGTIENVRIKIGLFLIPVVSRAATILNEFISVFLDLDDSAQKVIVLAIAIASLSAIIVGGIVAFKALAVVAGTIVAGGLATIGVLFIKVIAVIAVITAAVLVLRTAWRSNFGNIREITIGFLAFMQGVFEGLKIAFFAVVEAFRPAIDAIRTAFSEVMGVLGGVLSEVADALGLVGDNTTTTLEKFKFFGSIIGELVSGPLRLYLQWLAKIITFQAKFIAGVARIGSNLIDVFRNLGPVVQIMIGKLILTVVGGINRLVAGVIGQLNFLIPALNQFPGVNIGFIRTPELGGQAFARDLIAGATAEIMRRDTERARAGTPSESPGVGVTGGAAQPAGPAMPGSPSTQRQAFPQAVADAVARAIREVEDERAQSPIFLQGKIQMDGRDVGDVLKDDEGEQSARRGRFRPIFSTRRA